MLKRKEIPLSKIIKKYWKLYVTQYSIGVAVIFLILKLVFTAPNNILSIILLFLSNFASMLWVVHLASRQQESYSRSRFKKNEIRYLRSMTSISFNVWYMIRAFWAISAILMLSATLAISMRYIYHLPFSLSFGNHHHPVVHGTLTASARSIASAKPWILLYGSIAVISILFFLFPILYPNYDSLLDEKVAEQRAEKKKSLEKRRREYVRVEQALLRAKYFPERLTIRDLFGESGEAIRKQYPELYKQMSQKYGRSKNSHDYEFLSWNPALQFRQVLRERRGSGDS